jgi:transposase InsO family protein
MFLFAIKDLYDKRIVGYDVSKTYDSIFVTRCIEKALNENKVDDLIIHSDRGAQFTSSEYITLLNKYKVNISMSRKASPLDNAPIESFFRTFKNEIDIEKINNLSVAEAV